jgi:cystathionine beta-synthase
MPVVSGGQIIGSISESHLFALLMDKPKIKDLPIKEFMQEPFPVIQPGMPVDEISSRLTKTLGAVLVSDNGKMHIVTKHDILQALTN